MFGPVGDIGAESERGTTGTNKDAEATPVHGSCSYFIFFQHCI